MPISPPVKGPSRDPLRDWFPISKIHEGRWSLLLRVKPASSARTDSADFALRMLRAPARPGSFAHRRLQQEVAVTHLVRHSALTPVADFELHGAHPFTISRYVSGVPIATWTKSGATCPLGAACWIVRQSTDAARALHGASLRHGGISPANILISDVGRVTLVGLCSAVAIGAASNGDELAIKPQYAAPEQFRPGAEAAAASDIYSLGAVLFELLAKRPPYTAVNFAELEALHRLAPIPDVRSFAPEAPWALAALVRRMLTKEPLRRPCADEVISKLSDFEIASFGDWELVA